ncbi:hypothetical protein JOE65_002479 [Arthrobacter roseus]|nr:hypothetical protein [Arthrobacter roseus]
MSAYSQAIRRLGLLIQTVANAADRQEPLRTELVPQVPQVDVDDV